MPPDPRDPMDPPFPPEEKTDVRFKDDLEPPAGEGTYPCLEVVAGPGLVGSRFPLKQGTTTIGRSTENLIVLDDSSVSRLHAEVEVAGERLTVRDAGSRNGVKVSGQKIGQPMQVGQESQIKVGLYEFRLLLGPAGSPAPKPSEKKPEEEHSQSLPETVLEEPMVSEEPVPVQRQKSSLPKKLLFYLALIGITAASGTLMYRFLIPKLLPTLPPTEKEAKESEATGGIGQAPASSPQVATMVPIFLDFTASPIPAEIYFGGQKIGTTPFRIQTPLHSNKIYEVRAEFHLAEADQTLEAKVNFSPPPGTQVLTIPFVGRVGLFKIASLPRESTLYLEGYFETDPFRAKPIKFSEVVFDKPIYMPYGKYVLELRKNRQLGTSQTFLDEVVFHREFVISEQTNNYTIDIKDEELNRFPVEISSVPSGADVFMDDQKVGVTPYHGVFPVGDHALTLKKEGYFDYTQVVKNQINTPYLAEIKLQTSAAGEMINLANDRIKEARYKEAQDALVEGLKRSPTAKEVAQINYLLGIAFLRTNQLQEALGYFNQAMTQEDFKYQARLGIANVYFAQGEKIQALQLFIDVFMATEDPTVRSNAAQLFQQISPMKSVLFVASDPPGAKVMANTIEIAQPTPVILHDLGVGSYRITVSKPGYKPEELKMNIAVSEFKPILVKLKPATQ